MLSLVEQLQRRAGSQDLSEAIAQAVAFWLADTVLRSWSYGEHNYAVVEGDDIIHNGKAVTPNQFARSFARTTRNAWDDLYVRRPGDKQFKLACLLRKEILREPEDGRKARGAGSDSVFHSGAHGGRRRNGAGNAAASQRGARHRARGRLDAARAAQIPFSS